MTAHLLKLYIHLNHNKLSAWTEGGGWRWRVGGLYEDVFVQIGGVERENGAEGQPWGGSR